MYLKYLQYYVTVAECRNFSRAAEKLNTVQPSISRQIKKLEEIVGTQLLIRSHHELELTSAGEVFLEQSKIILNQFEQAKALALEAANRELNCLNVGLVSGTEKPFFEHVLTPVRESYPNLSVNLTTNSEVELVENVKNGSLDAGFVLGSINEPGLDYFTVCKQRIVVALSKNSPLASEPSVSIKDLIGLPFYLPKDNSPYYKAAIGDLLNELNIEALNVEINCDCPMSAMQSICLNDSGFCIILDFQSHLAPEGVVIKELDTINSMVNKAVDLVVIKSKQNQSQAISRLIGGLDHYS